MEEKNINSSVPAEVSFPAYSLKEQSGIEIETTGHFLCNVRTKEIIFKGTRLCDTAVLAGDRLVIF